MATSINHVCKVGRASPNYPYFLVLIHISLLGRKKDSRERQRELNYKQIKRENYVKAKGMKTSI